MGASEIIALVSAAMVLVEKGLAALESRRSGKEMTPEEEAAYDKLVADRMKMNHWKKSTSS